MVLRLSCVFVLQFAVALFLLVPSAKSDDVLELSRGKAIFVEQCATCHGEQGQGVEGAYDRPLEGDLAFQQLARYVDQTMPEGDPEACSGEDAECVTRYFMDAFYSRDARRRNNPATITFSRLTVDQYHNSITDVLRPILGQPWVSEKRGLKSRYFSKAKQKNEELVLERIDPSIDFDFAADVPVSDPELEDSEEFSIEWTGGLIAPETGTYEIFVRASNGFRLYLNQLPWGQETLIDNWVDSKEGDYRVAIRMRAGRVYPLTVRFMKYQEPLAKISLEWKPPHGERGVIPTSQLSPGYFPCVVNLQTELPPDDRSIGYERGAAVSAEWDRATTRGALEALAFVQTHREAMEERNRNDSQEKPTNSDKSDRSSREDDLRRLSEMFVQSAFRRPLESREREVFIDRAFETEPTPAAAFERIVLMTLKSPQFLYLPGFDQSPTQFDVATRLSMTLYDSLPDKRLLAAAESDQLLDRKQIRDQAWRLLYDPRTRVKVSRFFHDWLEAERAGMGTKDATLFPGFSDRLVISLRQSLDIMIDDIVWSEKSDFRELLTSDSFYVDSKLTEFYNLESQEASDASKTNATGFWPVEFEAERRSGVLTHPFLMAGFSYYRTTSPIHRGVFVAKQILGRTLKSPPVEVEPLEEDFDSKMTTRQRVAHQTKGTMCQSCHAIINPLGFSFENFDAAGRFRETEKSQSINAAAEYVDPAGETYRWNNASELAQFLVDNEDVHRNFIEQLFQFMAKQPLSAYGDDQVDRLLEKFRGSQFNMKNLIVEIATVVATHKMEQN